MSETGRADAREHPLFALIRRIVRSQVRRPWLWVLAAIAVSLPAYALARRLELHTGFESLLPDDKPSVKELSRVAARTAGVSTLAIVIDGDSPRDMQRFGDALLPPLRALGPEWVGTAEDGVQAEQEFLRKRRALFVPLETLRKLQERVEERFDYEVVGGIDEAPPPLTRESVERDLGVKPQSSASPADTSSDPPFPGGYYMNAEQKRLIVLVRTPIASGDLERTAALRRRVEAVVASVNPSAFHPSIRVGYTGDLLTSAEQYGAVREDLTHVGVAGVLMILAVDFLFFLRFRAVASMALAIGIGVLWTFGATELVIGHLNAASGFLVSIVFGNGLNFGVLFRARFGEARRAGADLETAIERAYRDTLRPTLTVAAAAGAGYLSLASTSFRGFRDFGAIGGYGMLLCWLSNYAFIAPLLVLFERARPDRRPREGAGRWRRLLDGGVPFGAPFAALVGRAPRLVAVASVLAGVAAVSATVRYVRRDPLEYDLGKLENDQLASHSTAATLGRGLTDITGRSGHDGMAIMTDRLDQVRPLISALEARKRAAPASSPPFSKIVSIYDLVPDQQPEKIAVLTQIRARLLRIHELGKLGEHGEEDWKAIEPNLPPADLVPFDIADLPERVARPFTERDGSRGRVVFIVPTEGRSVRDVHYLLQWADAYRSTTLPSGETIIGSGRAVIYADMLAGVIEQAPRAIALSLAMTVLVVVVAFRRGARGGLATLLVLGTLGLGLAWTGAAFVLAGVKLNFLNFVAIPITCGIGVDYAINVVHRWRNEPPGNIVKIVRETGGAVMLCSLTTVLGYLALLRSINAAVRSFGLAAVIGEFACISAALIALPATLAWLDARRLARPSHAPAPAESPLGRPLRG
jgi:hypothetical protein